jgi:rhamnosyltransferase
VKVAVIMSTYNGQKYLNEQIESILNQEGVKIELFIRDDGSSDGTKDILKKYEDTFSNVHVNMGQNIGFRKSFIMELRRAIGFDYYAFSDQDDYWDRKKLNAACKMIAEYSQVKDTPIVYYSNLSVADENLNIYRKTKLENRKHCLESLVMRRSIAGCTMAFNAEMWKLICKAETSDAMLMRGHDSFIMSLCYAIGGTVICDSNAYIRYRQHGDNTSGGSRGVVQRLKKEWTALFDKKGFEPAVAKSILDNWDELINDNVRSSLELISRNNENVGCRFLILISRKFTTGDLKLTVLGKFRAFAGLL